MTVTMIREDCCPSCAHPGGVCELPRRRSSALDRVRGLAVALMIVDHLALVAGVLPLRVTVGRIALPLFCLLAGHLVTRLSPRHVHLLGWGALLTLVAPWAGAPSILLALLGGMLVVLACRTARVPLALVVVLELTLSVNRWELGSTGYDLGALVALVVLGALLPRGAFAWGHRLPAWLEPVGRWALSIYVGHVLALTVAFA